MPQTSPRNKGVQQRPRTKQRSAAEPLPRRVSRHALGVTQPPRQCRDEPGAFGPLVLNPPQASLRHDSSLLQLAPELTGCKLRIVLIQLEARIVTPSGSHTGAALLWRAASRAQPRDDPSRGHREHSSEGSQPSQTLLDDGKEADPTSKTPEALQGNKPSGPPTASA